MSSVATVQDSLSPEILAQIAQSFGLDLTEEDYMTGEFLPDEWLQQAVGLVTGEHLWHTMWLFGIVLDDDGDYYVPSDHLIEVELIELNGPNRAKELQA